MEEDIYTYLFVFYKAQEEAPKTFHYESGTVWSFVMLWHAVKQNAERPGTGLLSLTWRVQFLAFLSSFIYQTQYLQEKQEIRTQTRSGLSSDFSSMVETTELESVTSRV